jgi:hypothetical protein
MSATSISGVTSTSPYNEGAPGSSSAPAGHANILVTPNDHIDPDEALSGFLVLEAMSRGVGLEAAIKNVNQIRQQKKAEWEKQKAALMEAMKAKQKSSFWGKLGKICGTIGKIAAVVASVAVAVGTGGAGAPLVLAVAGACLSAASLAQGEFKILQKLGVSDKVAGYIEIGMSVASVACSFGASALKGAEAVSTFQKIMNTSGKVVAIAGAVAGGAAGIASIKKGLADGEAQDWYAEVEQAKLNESHFEQLLIWVLDELENNEKEHRRTVNGIKDAIETRDATLAIASGAA